MLYLLSGWPSICSVITEPTQRYKWHELVEAIVSYISWWAKTAALQGIDFFGSKDFIPLLIRPIWYKLLSYTTARNKLLLDSLNNEMWILGATYLTKCGFYCRLLCYKNSQQRVCTIVHYIHIVNCFWHLLLYSNYVCHYTFINVYLKLALFYSLTEMNLWHS